MKPLLVLALALCAAPRQEPSAGFAAAVAGVERALEQNDLSNARFWLERALERDPKSVKVWDLRARLAEAAGDKDEQVYALHKELRLLVAQKAPKAEQEAVHTRLVALDPIAADLLVLSKSYVARLEPIAQQYEKDKRPHSAIRVHKQILALDPDHEASRLAIEKLASARDPSLAGDAKPRDLLEGVSKEWIREHDLQHKDWQSCAVLQRENYTTRTDAGYECLVRAAEAMEQMNAFYREFFRYGAGDDKKSVSRIELRIFKDRDEYLKLGSGPPVDWSGGQFTGDSVETYVGAGGFQEMTGTLFHEAAHQFVSLATNAAGWLNEGLASFFEGSRILPNGAVITNEPADHRLFPLVGRMKAGWMSSATDGIDPKDPDVEPKTAPTFRIVLENEYDWGPPWYAPTWGVVYFLYNYQDPVDGRYVFRRAFQEFIDASGGKTGKSAIKTFEEVVLANPKPPIQGVKRPDGAKDVDLPKNVDELDDVWNKWLTALADERSGKAGAPRPYLAWARCAIADKDPVTAKEHFEKGIAATPDDVPLLTEFAQLLAEQKNADRAVKLALRAAQVLEQAPKPDAKQLAELDRMLDKWDPKRSSLERVNKELSASGKALVARYQAAELPMMVMDLSWRLALDQGLVELLADFAAAAKSSKKTLQLWELAYNEKDLTGWADSGISGFTADGATLKAGFAPFVADSFDFRILTLDRLSGGDFSMEAEVQAGRGSTLFCGLVFGRKGTSDFHALILFPGTDKATGAAATGFVDLASSYGGTFKTWRHSPVDTAIKEGDTGTNVWHKLRIDVSGKLVDTWFDGEFLSTQEFPSLDVLRGSFGLIMGAGEARFRNVRFVARDPRDPSGRIERDVRMEPYANSVEAVAGSFLGKPAPFPKVKKWLAGERKDWGEAGPVPQLLVLWSIAQNDLIPLEGWLADLHARTRNIGLEFVSICSSEDGDKPVEYVKTHVFPGVVGLDLLPAAGMGETFKAYSLQRFNLPRLILLDVDGKVVWEGDPGFTIGTPWKSGEQTFLDTPLEELAANRKLVEFRAWLERWPGLPAKLHAGEFAPAAPALVAARAFDLPGSSALDDAKLKLAAVEGLFGALDASAASFAREECDPALAVLLAWGKDLGHETDKKVLVKLKPALESKVAKGWTQSLAAIDGYRKKSKKGPDATVAPELIAKIEAQPGRFPRELAADLKAALDKQDTAAFEAALADAPARPARWLAAEYLRW